MGTSNYYVIDKRDGYAKNSNVTYATARTAATSDSMDYDGYSNIAVGQDTGYDIYRGYIYVDTSRIGAGSNISAASLWVYVASVSGSGWAFQLQDGQSTYPTEAYPVVADYDMTQYSGDMGTSADVSTMSAPEWVEIELTSAGMAAINKTGITKFCVRSTLDIAGTPPSGSEYGWFRACDYGDQGQYYMTVTHDGPTQVTIEHSAVNDASYCDIEGAGGWASVHDATDSDSVNTDGVQIGTWGSGSTRAIYRQMLKWDTSSIPGNAIINSVAIKLSLMTITDTTHTLRVVSHSDPASPMIVNDYDKTKWSDNHCELSIDTTDIPDSGWRYFNLDASGIAELDPTGDTYYGIREKTYDIDDANPGAGSPYYYSNFRSYFDGSLYPALVVTYTLPTNDTAVIKQDAYKYFATRLVSNDQVYNVPYNAPIGYIRLYDSSGDYIQVNTARNDVEHTPYMFDDVGSTEADPEHTSVTQDYRDLNLSAYIPKFNILWQPDSAGNDYADATFSIVTYKLFTKGGLELGCNSSGFGGFDIIRGTSYRFRFTIRFFNDHVEQVPFENARSVVTEDGLSVVLRRMVQNNITQENGTVPGYIGIGGRASQYIADGSDETGYYDLGTDHYTTSSTLMFPNPSAVGDAYFYIRAGSSPDKVNGFYFDFDTFGVLATNGSYGVQYYDENDTWSYVKYSVDYTENMAMDNYIYFEPPEAIKVADADEIYTGSPQGHAYRILMVGAPWDTNPTLSAVGKPQVLVVSSNDTDLLIPFNRLGADVVASPYTGAVAKFSAEHGIGAAPALYDSEGLLRRTVSTPVSELALFTTDGLVLDEELPPIEITVTTSAAGVVTLAKASYPQPLRLMWVRDTSTNLLYEAGDRFMRVGSDATNWYFPIDFGPPSTEYDIAYLPKTIIPTNEDNYTVQNILSVSGNSNEIVGPSGIWVGSSDKDPANPDKSAWRDLTPFEVQRSSRRLPPEYVDSAGPNYSRPHYKEAVADADFIQGSFKKEKVTMGDIGYWMGSGGGKRIRYYKAKMQVPYVMLEFDVSDVDKVKQARFVLSMMGEMQGKFGYNALIWGKGKLSDDDQNQRFDGWRLLATSGDKKSKVSSGKRLPSTLAIGVDPKYEQVAGTTDEASRIIHNGSIYIMVALRHYAGDTGSGHSVQISKTMGSIVDWSMPGVAQPGETQLETATRAAKEFSSMTNFIRITYAGMSLNPVAAGGTAYEFRKGIDWKYVVGDSQAEWQLGKEDEEYYRVVDFDGVSYDPILPTVTLGKANEQYLFYDTSPNSNSDITLYTRYRPHDSMYEVRVEKEAKSKIHSTKNGRVVVNYVGWDASRKWNGTDDAYQHNHSAGTGGTGAGIVNIDVDAKDWDADVGRRVNISYYYVELPRLKVSYLVQSGLMFARAILHEWSHHPPIKTTTNTRARVYYEVEVKAKRSA